MAQDKEAVLSLLKQAATSTRPGRRDDGASTGPRCTAMRRWPARLLYRRVANAADDAVESPARVPVLAGETQRV